jgi:hypothetical protein
MQSSFVASWGRALTIPIKIFRKKFGSDPVSCAQVFRWHKDFVRWREAVADELQSGRPACVRTSTNVDHVRAFIHQDRHLTIRMTADELNVNDCTVHQIVTQDLNMRKVCAKMVPNHLNDNQKVHRNQVLVEMLQQLETEPDFLHWVITTRDESSFSKYDPETKRQSEEWHTS